MRNRLTTILASHEISASAPCRIDMGGTLDISTFYCPMRHLSPCTFNIAVNLRTRVRLFPYRDGAIKVTSRGFESAEYPIDKAPFDHPFGIVFSTAAYFRAEGIHIDIDSSSPPRSALGGSSSATVALVAALLTIHERMNGEPFSRQQVALLAHTLEASVAGVPCGLQDQLAAVFGGVNAWYWTGDVEGPPFRRSAIVKEAEFAELRNNLLLAYCGAPHESKDINGKWVRQFLSGDHREDWAEIAACTRSFVDAFSQRNFREACIFMNRETEVRRKMTPDVLDAIGGQLVDSAAENGCGGRFAGAGGGGCIWALGDAEHIDKLKGIWERILATREGARLLDVEIASEGVVCDVSPNIS